MKTMVGRMVDSGVMSDGEEGMMAPGNVLSSIHSLLSLITQLWEAGTILMPTF